MSHKESNLLGSNLKDCPPSDAEKAYGIAYRIVENDPPNESDFIPISQNPKSAKRFKSIKEPERKCIASGISLYRSKKDALEAKSRSKDLSDESKPAKAELNASCGLIKGGNSRMESSHITLWHPKDLEIWKLFEVV